MYRVRVADGSLPDLPISSDSLSFRMARVPRDPSPTGFRQYFSHLSCCLRPALFALAPVYIPTSRFG